MGRRPTENIHTAHPELTKLLYMIRQSPRTLNEVTLASGLADGAVSKWQRGVATPLLPNVEAVANVLGYTFKLVPMEDEQ